MRSWLFSFIVISTMAACTTDPHPADGPTKVEIVATADGFRLLRGGKPYEIRGAGMVTGDVERFAAHGGNSVRNWTTDDSVQNVRELLDTAQAHNVTVALCLPLTAERHGFDYDDPEAVAAQLAAMRAAVLRYRDHPALLFWIIGNELDHSYTNPAVYDAVNEVARMIEELDPNHPTTTAVSGFKPDVIAEIQTRAPALDFISFQIYGSLFGLPDKVAAAGFRDPFMVTEWGTLGYWEMETTSWGAPVELTSTEKAAKILKAHRDNLEPLAGQLLGSYVFKWGQKQERTPTWFGLLLEDGTETESVDVMHHIWKGNWPDNRSPQVRSMTLDGKEARESLVLQAGQAYGAALDVVDPDIDSFTYRWEVKPESDANQVGGDFEESIGSLEGFLSDPAAASTTLTAPAPGNYRLFAYAFDDHGNAAHANIPFRVEGEFRQRPEDLLAGEVMAVAYSGFREGQHPDRGAGAKNPSRAEILEDLEILLAHDLDLVRMYDTGENTRSTLELIREHGLPMRVLLGIWLRAEVSNHEGCPWLDEPIPDEQLAANVARNEAEVERGIELAKEFSDIVVAVNVGNEALVDWNDHMVPLERVIGYVRRVKAAIEQPVTVADNYEWWIRDGAPLAAEVDFLGVHTYPVWEDRPIDEGLAYTVENIERVSAALPGKPIAILEAGWATKATEFGERASETFQARYFAEMKVWAARSNTTVFFFEAFDEPWKGDENDPLGAEKNWGLFNVDRTPKQVFKSSAAADDG